MRNSSTEAITNEVTGLRCGYSRPLQVVPLEPDLSLDWIRRLNIPASVIAGSDIEIVLG